uniref:Uncharacterized protein n=2 Tax=Poecilia latipinna TaxID=48699 RepID=A0A3B3V9U0_9TELE
MERAHRFEDNQRLAQLEAELEETKLQLKRQKALKEVFINKGKETKRELERIEKLCDPAVINAASLASKVHNDMKYKNKKMLQQDFVELKMAHLLSQEAFTSEIQAEKEKSKTLQEELDKLQTSHEELCSKYESDVALVRQEAEMQKIYEVRVSEVQLVLENLRAEKDNMFQKMSEEIAFLQSSEKSLQAELDQVKRSYEELNQKYEKDVSGLKAQVETYDKELEREREASSDRANKDLEEINKLREDRDFIYESMTKEFTFLQISEHNLQVELDQVKSSYEELDQKYERDVSGLKAQVETYEKELEREREASSDRAKKDLEEINNLREDRDFIYESITKEFTFLQSSEKSLQAELDQVKHSYEELGQKYERDVSGLEAQVETYEKE